MARKPGKQKRAVKHKQRREQRRKQRVQRPVRVAGRSVRATGRPAVARDGPLDDAALARVGYDANRAAGGADVLAIGEQERLDRVAAYHRTALPPDRQPPSMTRHAAMHAIAEVQLASQDPPAAPRALARLRAEGLSRHDALHAIGWVLTGHMSRALEGRQPLDLAAYGRDLDALTVKRWLEQAGIDP